MLRYILKRLVQMIPILLIVAVVIFSLMQFVPGDPVEILLGDSATEAQILEVQERLGLNKPYFEQLVNFFKGLFRLDFGNSYMTGMDVGTELLQRFPHTLTLAILCVAFTALIGVPIGISCALHADKFTDRAWMFLTMLCNSMPSFWLALMLVLLFSLKLDLLPSTFGKGGLVAYILPVVSNSLGTLAGTARQTRASMLEVIRADFVSTARSKGISEKAVIWKHAFPNALIPIITDLGARFGMLLGGTMITESVFSIPGLGLYMLNGINNRDYPVVQGCIIYLAFMFSILMLVTDLIYAFVDPRIKAQYMGTKKKKAQTPESKPAAAV